MTVVGEPIMANQCAVCGKKPAVGNSIEIRGKAKYLGGVGTKVTGITRRRFKPNLQVAISGGAPSSPIFLICQAL